MQLDRKQGMKSNYNVPKLNNPVLFSNRQKQNMGPDNKVKHSIVTN